jgi:hypothetical protein
MTSVRRVTAPGYSGLIKDLSGLLESARRAAARTVNAVMTATYWEIGRRIVEFEQGGERRAEYGAELLETLAADLTKRFGRGFSPDNLESMRRFYRAFPPAKISETLSRKSSRPERRPLSVDLSDPIRTGRDVPLVLVALHLAGAQNPIRSST